MKLYDSTIKKSLELAGSQLTPLSQTSLWKNLDEKVFIFPGDSAVELGASDKDSSYLIAYTTEENLVNKDEILLRGKDIKDLKGDEPFARIAILLIDDSKHQDEQKIYRFLRDIEYKRYKVNPDGYMIRVNTNKLREGARVSKAAVKKGISFADVGKILQDAYKQDENVKAVKQIFITDPSFDFETFAGVAKLNEGITVTLDHILKNLKMDCNTCSFKDICDTIEGMRDIHKREDYEF